MSGGGRKRRTLGRGMGDLIGDDLESLVRSSSENPVAPPSAEGREPRGEQEGPQPADGAAADGAPSTAGLPDSADGPGAAAADRPYAPRSPEVPSPRIVRSRGQARVFAVASGKGGTGKSLIAANLAVAMADARRICLIDADFGLGNAHILLGVLPRWNISHLIRGEKSLDEILVEGPRGLVLLPGASGVPAMASLDDVALDGFALMLEPVLERFDDAVLDCPAGLTRQSLVMLHGADVVVVVTTDALTSMTDAYALIKTLVTHRPDLVLGLVVNEARSPAEGAETYRKICHVSRKFLRRDLISLGTVPRDPQLERSVMERRPVVVGHPRSPAARAILDLAARLAALHGPGASAGFPERMHRTLASAGAGPAAAGGSYGEGLCMS